MERRSLREVQRLALRKALDDVDQSDVGQAGFSDPLCRRGADVAGPDDRDLATTDSHPWTSVSGTPPEGPAGGICHQSSSNRRLRDGTPLHRRRPEGPASIRRSVWGGGQAAAVACFSSCSRAASAVGNLAPNLA